MRQAILFEKGDKVQVIKGFCNASDFTLEIEGASPRGIYDIENWEDKVFTIKGECHLISFDHDPTIYSAYLLCLNGEPVGYVYNNALKLAPNTKKEKYIDFLKESIEKASTHPSRCAYVKALIVFDKLY